MKKLIGVIVVVLSVFVISCQKDQDLFIESELLSEKSAQIVVSEISVDNAMADINFESDFFIGAEGMMMGMNGGMNGGMQGGMHGYSMQNWNQGNGLHYMMGQYPQYSMHGNQTQYPDSMVMNYGMGTQLNNGRVMSGSMIIHTSEEPNGNGYSREITYGNFSVDSMSIMGMTQVFITGDHQNGGSHMISGDLIITMPDGTTIHRESEIVREWIAGSETNLNQTDDIMQVTGHVINTVNENGTETVYRKDIIEPLIKSSSCRYFSQGIIELTMSGSIIATLDYGNGECDDIAMLTKVGEVPVEIILTENDHCSNYQNSGMGMGHFNGQQHDNGTSTGTGHGTGMGHGTSSGGHGHGNGGGRG